MVCMGCTPSIAVARQMPSLMAKVSTSASDSVTLVAACSEYIYQSNKEP